MAIDHIPTALSLEEIDARRAQAPPTDRVVFRVADLYGVCPEGFELPLNEHETIHSGPASLSIDPDADPLANLGIVDFPAKKLRVRYGAQLVFPGLHELVVRGDFDPSLLRPVKATATDDCTVTDDYTGWHALGTLEFLPGSVWAGAGGG